MASAVPEMESASIVLVGRFNPAILHPQWFAKQGLIRDSEAANAQVDLVSSAMTSVRFEWFTLRVGDDRLSATTTDPAQYQALQECISGTFALLEFTPVGAMGLNSERHVRVASEDIWTHLESTLAPRDLRAKVLHGPQGEPSALQTLSVVGARPNSPAERLKVTIEPSVRFPGGICVRTNEHFGFRDGSDASVAMKELRENWPDALAYSKEVTDRLTRLAIDH